jgi:hypothetical protein
MEQPRIQFIPPKSKCHRKRPETLEEKALNPLNKILAYEDAHKHYDEHMKSIQERAIHKHEEKAREKSQQAMNRILWFIMGSHILMAIEYALLWRRIL